MFRGKSERSTLHFSIARGLFGSRLHSVMAFLTYLDTSGSGLDPLIKALSVGGFVGDEAAWAEFEPQWEAILTRFGVSELHMRDYAHSVGEFESWKGNVEKRADFMAQLGALIKGSDIQPIGATMPLSVYRLFNRYYCVQEALGAPHAFASQVAIAMSAQWRDVNHVGEPMVFYVEKGDNQQEDLRRVLARVIWDAGYAAEPIIHPKRWTDRHGVVHRVIPFQACDFIAYEQAKAVTDMITKRKTQLRRSFTGAVKPIEEIPDGRTYWTVMEKRSFEKSMRVHKVPRRYNHASVGLRRKLPIDPLCYVDGRPAVAYFYEDGYLTPEE
jgi:hypothetical protein